MKKLSKLKGAKALNKKEQQSIVGGRPLTCPNGAQPIVSECFGEYMTLYCAGLPPQTVECQ